MHVSEEIPLNQFAPKEQIKFNDERKYPLGQNKMIIDKLPMEKLFLFLVMLNLPFKCHQNIYKIMEDVFENT